MPNKYLDRLELLIKDFQGIDLDQFQGPGGNKAKFDDLVWYHVDPRTGRRTRYLSCRHGAKGQRDNSLGPHWALPYPYDHLVKIWIIEVSNRSSSQYHKQRLVELSRILLSHMEGGLYEQTASSLANILPPTDRGQSQFIDFCSERKLMPNIRLYIDDRRDRTGHHVHDTTTKKLPSDQGLMALGDIYGKIFADVNPDGTVVKNKSVFIGDALTVTFACISLASPNRTAAELPLLPKQRLSSYSEGNQPQVYSLDWKGSKGYKDYKNHILCALAPQVQQALNFFYVACEPARILCRFFENPNQTLNSLLGEFKVDPKRRAKLSLSIQPNLFQLGYALGFYDVAAQVPVLTDKVRFSAANHIQRASCFTKKGIWSLHFDDELSTAISQDTRHSCLSYLFDITFQSRPFGSREVVSVSELQNWWISYLKESLIQSFPFSYSTAESCIRLADAMFCLLGSSFVNPISRRKKGGNSGAKRYQSSHYAIASLEKIGGYSSRRISGSARGTSIFEDYGFPKEVGVKAHSLRHYANTLASMSDIPVEVVTAWSGRVNPEQTHTYIHRSEDEKADQVQAIANPPSGITNNIRYISVKELSQTTHLPASVTSTGLCTQELNVTPCNYLNDFVSQCAMCPESCHIAGDKESISLLDKDVSYQRARLEAIECDPRLSTSEAMKKWYLLHSRNTFILSQLVSLMKERPVGTIIRYSNINSEFQLTDLNTMRISNVTCTLPKTKNRLEKLLENSGTEREPSSNSDLKSLLSFFNLTE